MIVVSWNIRGAGALEKKSAISDIIHTFLYDIILIQEVKFASPSQVFFQSLGGSRIDEWLHLDACRSFDEWLHLDACRSFGDILIS